MWGAPRQGCKVCTWRITTRPGRITTPPTGSRSVPQAPRPSSPGNLASCEAAGDAVCLGSSGTRSREPDALRPKRKFHSPEKGRAFPWWPPPHPRAQQPGLPRLLSPHSHQVLLPSGSFRSCFCQRQGLNCKRGGQWSVRFRRLSSCGENGLFWGMSTAGGPGPGPLTSWSSPEQGCFSMKWKHGRPGACALSLESETLIPSLALPLSS